MCDQHHYTDQGTFSIELHVVVFTPSDWAHYESLLLYDSGQTVNRTLAGVQVCKTIVSPFLSQGEWKLWRLHLLWDVEVHATYHCGSLSQCLESEAPRQSHDAAAPAPSWPQQGKISFQGVELRYREELPLVLKNLSFTILAEETIGIVGRTGSGISDSRNFGYVLINTYTLSFIIAPVCSCRKVVSGCSSVQTCGANWRLHYHWRYQYFGDWFGRPAKQDSHHSSRASALHWHCQVIYVIINCINEL